MSLKAFGYVIRNRARRSSHLLYKSSVILKLSLASNIIHFFLQELLIADRLIILQSRKPYLSLLSILSVLSVLSLLFLHFVKVSIWAIRIENLVAVHDGHEVFGFAQVDDVVGVAREHDDALNLIT